MKINIITRKHTSHPIETEWVQLRTVVRNFRTDRFLENEANKKM